jgi:cobalt-zinc-cadmium efflux system outer membrane protein
VNVGVLKDFSVDPKQTTPTLGLAIPLGVWDRNQGAILAAEAALIRAEEEPHAAEMQLTNQLANNFTNYKNNLEALDYYRNYILPDQVRTYRGTFHRRQVDPNASFGDLVQAQQTLTTNVATYLTILGQLWTSVVSVADLIETDDLFAFSRPQTVPALPDVSQLPQLPCCHEPSTGSPAASATAPVPMSSNMPSSMPSSMLSNMSTNGPAGPGPMSGSMPLSGTVPVGGPAFAAGPMPVVGPAPVSGAGLEPFVGRGRE